MTPQLARVRVSPDPPIADSTSRSPQALLPEWIFRRMLCLERKRAERSSRRLVLMLVESEAPLLQPIANKILEALDTCVRDTDIVGWYTERESVGVLFTEIAAGDTRVSDILSAKSRHALDAAMSPHQSSRISLSFLVFPDDFDGKAPSRRAFATMFPDLAQEIDSKQPSLAVKRCIDVLGSLALLFLLSPILLLIASLVKFTSKGPILFRQTRLGRFGEGFTFLKFRSMYVETNHAVHQTYVERFISNQTHSDGGDGPVVYKLANDPRITKIGAFLRRTSLDELPQLFNVLSGKMSLVGPRPPVSYEFAAYKTWHKRRLFVKPGITGSWQVDGRSRVKFDEMVRMDLRYAATWSLWLDIKILLRTPRAVLGGSGAY